MEKKSLSSEAAPLQQAPEKSRPKSRHSSAARIGDCRVWEVFGQIWASTDPAGSQDSAST